jgi:hypothetical protein
MSIALAVRRSYRYFVPSTFLDPRRLARRAVKPAAYFLMGTVVGADLLGPARVDRFFFAVSLAVIVLAWLVPWLFDPRAEMGSSVAR